MTIFIVFRAYYLKSRVQFLLTSTDPADFAGIFSFPDPNRTQGGSGCGMIGAAVDRDAAGMGGLSGWRREDYCGTVV